MCQKKDGEMEEMKIKIANELKQKLPQVIRSIIFNYLHTGIVGKFTKFGQFNRPYGIAVAGDLFISDFTLDH